MIQLCNSMHLDAWINVPARADDDYIRNLASLWKAGLDKDLNVYFEYSNEGERSRVYGASRLASALCSVIVPPIVGGHSLGWHTQLPLST